MSNIGIQNVVGEPQFDIIEKTDLIRMVVITLGEHQEVPWHWHKECPDTFIGMQGSVLIETDDDRKSTVLAPGKLLKVEPGIRHRVSGVDGKPCRVAVLQGVGKYDLQIG